jgi:beta-galactosidase
VEGLRGNVDVNDARWHHVVGVYDGRRLSLYVDGKLDTSAPAVTFSRINTSKDHVLIGMNARSRLWSREWNGLIDDLRIYNYALRPEDVKALHEGREPLSDQESTKP